ncbi:hypothetical protein JCM8097_001893 [Rhodosporidiobolus ruineniae]
MTDSGSSTPTLPSPPSSPPRRGVFRNLDDYFTQHPGVTSKLQSVFPGIDQTDFVALSLGVLFGTALAVGVVGACFAGFGADFLSIGPLYWLNWSVVATKAVIHALRVTVDFLDHYLVRIPLEAMMQVVGWVGVEPLLALILAQPILYFVVYPYFLWCNRFFALATLFPCTLPGPVARLLDYAILPVALQYALSYTTYFRPFMPFAYAVNAYVVFASLFGLFPIRSFLAAFAKLDDWWYHASAAGGTIDGATASEVEQGSVERLERENAALRKALQERGHYGAV